MRLIDADVLFELINGGYDVNFDEVPETKRELLNMITYQETVDAEPVVRCRDCVCGEERVDKNRLTYWFCTFAQHPTAKHNYCVWGERKDDVQSI